VKWRREIIVPASVSSGDRRPIRAETRVTLVASIARGRRWLDEIIAGTVTGVEQIAAVGLDCGHNFNVTAWILLNGDFDSRPTCKFNELGVAKISRATTSRL
jgi:hypothetical protein